MVMRRGGSNHMDRTEDSRTCDVAVIGAGPSGCMAAAAAARNGLQTFLFDANDRVGKKIYATGNGRCNLTNLHLDNSCYHLGGREDLSAFFARFCVEDHIHFWESEGIFLHDRQGYVYPRTDQASTIAEAFEKILRGNPHCSFAMNFRCFPFWYQDNVAETTVTVSGTTITNPGSVYSEPVLTVTGSGDITLTVGTTIVELTGITDSIVIDCALKEAYKGTTLMNEHMSGDFPILVPGLNAISWTGNVTRVVVKPNWRYL